MINNIDNKIYITAQYIEYIKYASVLVIRGILLVPEPGPSPLPVPVVVSATADPTEG